MLNIKKYMLDQQNICWIKRKYFGYKKYVESAKYMLHQIKPLIIMLELNAHDH